jgi:hypothetical protein
MRGAMYTSAVGDDVGWRIRRLAMADININVTCLADGLFVPHHHDWYLGAKAGHTDPSIALELEGAAKQVRILWKVRRVDQGHADGISFSIPFQSVPRLMLPMGEKARTRNCAQRRSSFRSGKVNDS